MLRGPEAGLVMVRGRAGGGGSPFNLGEMTVTRCTVRTETGFVGHAYVAGRESRRAELAALVDALMQDPDRCAEIETAVIAPLRSRRHAEGASAPQRPPRPGSISSPCRQCAHEHRHHEHRPHEHRHQEHRHALPRLPDPVADAQSCFRAVLDAMARPGRIRTVPAGLAAPSPLCDAAAALLLTLVDHETPLWLDPAAEPARGWIGFHTGAPVVPPAQALFALALSLPDLAALPQRHR